MLRKLCAVAGSIPPCGRTGYQAATIPQRVIPNYPDNGYRLFCQCDIFRQKHLNSGIFSIGISIVSKNKGADLTRTQKTGFAYKRLNERRMKRPAVNGLGASKNHNKMTSESYLFSSTVTVTLPPLLNFCSFSFL
jgi:hypothetical protein